MKLIYSMIQAYRSCGRFGVCVGGGYGLATDGVSEGVTVRTLKEEKG